MKKTKKILIILSLISILLISGCMVSEGKYNEARVESEIKSDYLELYEYLLVASYIEGSLDHQHWQIDNDPDGIFPDIYMDELNIYKAQVTTIKDKLTRLISKMELHSNLEIRGLPEALNTISKLEDLRAGFDLAISIYEAGLLRLE